MRRGTGKPVDTSKLIVLGFLSVILIGTFLLMLPISSREGVITPFLTALFTATSATCVTGLVVVDTYSYWNAFGQSVILILIQIGGLGFMTMATLFSFALRRRITLKERMVMSSALNITHMSGVVRLTRNILLATFSIEAVGALILATRFYKDFGFFGAIGRGIFHSISAFCNAGFDILGHDRQFNSMTDYVFDPVLNITLMALIVIGGLGFFVWGDLYRRKRLSTHTKLVLITTSILIVSGTLLYLAFEFNNPETIGNMNFSQKVLASSFQSVTTRTAGFNTIDQSALTEPSTFLTYILMFIGGSPGSTAGGVKTVTIAILLLTAVKSLQGKTRLHFLGRRIKIGSVLNAVSIFVIAIVIVIFGVVIISAVEPFSLDSIVYEVISAFATVGLSTGITSSLASVSQVVLIALMFFGRVGILTLGLSLFMGQKHETKVTYPEGIILIG